MAEKNITMVRGDTLSFGLELVNEELLDTAYFSCKTSYSAEEYAFQKSLEDGITEEDAGIYKIRVAPEDTADLDPGTYYYDFEIGANGDKFTIIWGTLTLLPDVTGEGG